MHFPPCTRTNPLPPCLAPCESFSIFSWVFTFVDLPALLLAYSSSICLGAVRARSMYSALMKLFARSMNSHNVVGIFRANSCMNGFPGQIPPRRAIENMFWSSVVIHSQLNGDKYNFKLLSSHCLTVKRYASSSLLFLLTINYVRKRRASSPNPSMDPKSNNPNHTLVGPFNVKGKD